MRIRLRRLRALFKMTSIADEIPWGVVAIRRLGRACCPWNIRKELLYKASILFLTYFAYMCYHLARKPLSVVKSVLHGDCPVGSNGTHCGYAPFDGADSSELFSLLDFSYLCPYAIFMFMSGWLAERSSLRYFLSMGMALSGLCLYLFGMARHWAIHNLWYFVIIQVLSGIFQTTGWPVVVTLMARWFGNANRGLIFGIWNSHTSVGNILGTLIAANYVETSWDLSFIVPAVIVLIVTLFQFLFLVERPESVGCPPADGYINIEDTPQPFAVHTANVESNITHRTNERTPILQDERSTDHSAQDEAAPINFLQAFRIPGVIDYSMCLFFNKLVSYTFMFWLPFYIQTSSTLGPELSAYLSTLFDVGGVLGGIIAGHVCDKSKRPATVSVTMLVLAIPTLLAYQLYGSTSVLVSSLLLVAVGILVNGPYALITTTVSTELGQRSPNALATVTAIIDGTGSIGATIGPAIAGVVATGGWQNVFYMLFFALTFALLLLLRELRKEVLASRRQMRVRIE